jgi:hypothetical protein
MTGAPKLPLAIRRTVEAMAHGVDRPLFPGTAKEIPAGTPLALKQAAIAIGCRVKRAEAAAKAPEFVRALAEETAIRRASEDPRSLAVAIKIRDNPGDGLPSDRHAQLAAIKTIRGKPPVRARTPKQAENGPPAGATAGYIIALDLPEPEPPKPDVPWAKPSAEAPTAASPPRVTAAWGHGPAGMSRWGLAPPPPDGPAHTLTRYDAMCRAIAEAYQVDEVKDIRDRAVAIEVYSRQAKNTEAERHAAEIRVRAERRCGELLKDMPKAKGAAEAGWNKPETRYEDATAFEDEPKTLSDLGISKRQSSEWQQLAEVPEEEFEQALAEPEKPSATRIINRTSFTGNNQWFTPAEYLIKARAVLGAIDLQGCD